MNTSLQAARYFPGVAAGVLLVCGGSDAPAEPPPSTESGGTVNAPASDVQALAPQGSFLSSLKQGFAQDLEREVVRGHFDVSLPSGTQRYYCLLDPKTAKNEINAVSGQLVSRRDGTTGIKGAAVTFYRCADAEQKGLLVTTGYLVSGSVSGKSLSPAIKQGPPRVTATTAPVPAAALTQPESLPPKDSPIQADARQQVLDLGKQWVIAENRHDATTLRRILDDKFIATFGTKRVHDKEAFIKEILAGDIDPTQTQTLMDETVLIDRDTAVVVGTDTVRGTENGTAYTEVLRYTVTYVYRNGRWVALAEHLVKVPQ